MSRLYLHCVICSRRQADGLISGAAWGKLDLPPGAQVQHPAVNDATCRVCPSCIGENPDWQARVLTSFGLASGFSPRLGT